MADSGIEAGHIKTKPDQWAERILSQQSSGLSVKEFCKEHGLAECSFYAWRKRLRNDGPVRFALVDRQTAAAGPAETVLEVVLTTGECLRIGSGVDRATLRTVLEALRA